MNGYIYYIVKLILINIVVLFPLILPLNQLFLVRPSSIVATVANGLQCRRSSRTQPLSTAVQEELDISKHTLATTSVPSFRVEENVFFA